VESIKGMFALDTRVQTELSVEELSLDIDMLIPCGLIINELLTNVFKHAFEGVAEPRLSLTLRSKGENEIVLEVSDNGVGLPPGFDMAGAKTLGIMLVGTLVKQINGELKVAVGPEGGTLFSIKVPLRVMHTGL